MGTVGAVVSVVGTITGGGGVVGVTEFFALTTILNDVSFHKLLAEATNTVYVPSGVVDATANCRIFPSVLGISSIIYKVSRGTIFSIIGLGLNVAAMILAGVVFVDARILHVYIKGTTEIFLSNVPPDGHV